MKTIFAVDDDVALLSLLGNVLAAHGYSMQGHPKLSGAFERVHEMKPDVLFLDVMLPDGAGYELARQIRKDMSLYKTPILFVSALGDVHEVKYALAQGGDAYLSKPFSIQHMLERLKRLDVLTQRVHEKDTMTGFLTLEAMEKEMEHLLFREEEFFLTYMSIDSFDKFVSGKGQTEGDALVQWMAQLLRQTLRDLQVYECRLSHLGADHFLVLLPKHVHRFCHAVTEAFDRKKLALYHDFELRDGYSVVASQKGRGTYSGHPLMTLRVDIVHCTKETFTSRQEILHQLKEAHQQVDHEHAKAVFRWDQGKKW
jgi:chemotaxis family two-component system response regulator PixH